MEYLCLEYLCLEYFCLENIYDGCDRKQKSRIRQPRLP